MDIHSVSIIVPVYNAEKHLDKCITSILTQVYTNIELILVDDGSQDNSYNICEKYEKKDSRVRLIHQENQGVSAARNQGIRAATGEFLLFVDSDDYIDTALLSSLFEKEEILKSDIAFFGYTSVNNGENIAQCTPNEYCGTRNADILYDLMERNLFGLACNKLIRRDIVWQNKVTFPEGMKLQEDQAFMIDLWPKIENVCCANNAMYYYVQHSGSTMASSQKETSGCIEYNEKNLNTLLAFMRSQQIKEEKIREFGYNYVTKSIRRLFGAFSATPKNERKTTIEKYSHGILYESFEQGYLQNSNKSGKEVLFHWFNVSGTSVKKMILWLFRCLRH